MITIKWTGLREFGDYLNRLARVARPRGPFMRRLEGLGRMALGVANVNTPVRTGRLQRGNLMTVEGMSIVLYNEVEYAPFVHDRIPFLAMGIESIEPLLTVAGIEALEAV